MQLERPSVGNDASIAFSITVSNLTGMIEGPDHSGPSLTLLMPAIINNNQRDPSDASAPTPHDDPVTEIEARLKQKTKRKRKETTERRILTGLVERN